MQSPTHLVKSAPDGCNGVVMVHEPTTSNNLNSPCKRLREELSQISISTPGKSNGAGASPPKRAEPEEKSEEILQEKLQGKPKENLEKRLEGYPEEDRKEKPEESLEETPQEKLEEKPQEKPEEDPEENGQEPEVRFYSKEKLLNGDDSSDEESERNESSQSLVERLHTTSLTVEDEMLCSFLLFSLGNRILMSEKVTNLYYELKSKELNYIADLPSNQTICDHFKDRLETIVKSRFQGNQDEIDELQQSEAYKNYLKTILENKLQFLSYSSLYSRFNETNFVRSLEESHEKFRATKYSYVHDFVKDYRQEWGGTLQRRVLDNSREFLKEEKNYNPAKFFAHLRLDHCSAKRTLKNTKNPETIVRKYTFGSNNKFFATNTHSATKCFSGMQPKVSYEHITGIPYSTYDRLFQKINELCESLGMTKACIVRNIRSLLKTGKLEKDDDELEKFLTTFTFHLFGAETTRHPAALIYNVLTLDLIENFDGEFDSKLFPMSQKGTVECVRQIQSKLYGKLPWKYHFDYKPPYTQQYNQTTRNEGLESFQEREKYLLKEWMTYKLKLKDPKIDDGLKCKCSPLSKLQFLQECNKLCKDYYDIDLLDGS